MEKEIRKQLRSMENMEHKAFGKYSVMKMGNRYSFSFITDDYDECSWIGCVGGRQAISWIKEQ